MSILRLILIFGLIFGSLKADFITNECVTDIWFGNGVWNSEPQAIESKKKIKSLVLRSIYAGDASYMQQKHGKEIYLAYNWGKGYMADVLETYYQLKKAGQFEDVGFFTSIALLISDTLDAATKAAYELAFNVAIEEREADNADGMWNDYYYKSLRQSHRVLLISHSQGNLFANRLYEDFVAPLGYGSYFANLQVASPADHVGAGLGKYVTISIDPVINPIPKSLKPNASGNPGHGFVEAYLTQADPLNKIVENTKLLLNQLDAVPSQWHEESGDSCLEGRLVTFQHNFNSGLEPLEHVFYASQGKIRQVGGLLVSERCKDAQDTNQTSEAIAIEGMVEVQLSWDHPLIDMDLNFEAGAKDIEDVDNLGLEHYYVKSESEIPPGIYGIDVTYGGNGEGTECLSSSPLTLVLNIKTPDGIEFFGMDLASRESLDVGLMADLHVSDEAVSVVADSQKIVQNQLIPLTHISTANSRNTASKQSQIYELIPRLDQALFGPLGGAEIGLYNARLYHQNAQPLYAGSTTYGSSNVTTGLIHIPAALKEELEDNAMYVIEITGGEDIDANDDMMVDLVPTANLGSSHAIITGSKIKEQGFKVNIVTAMAYEMTKELLEENRSIIEITERLDDVALRMIKEDLNGDGVINYSDLLKWTPYFDKKKLIADYDSKIAPIVEKIYLNQDIYADVYTLLYASLKVDAYTFEEGSSDNNLTIEFDGYVDQALIDAVTFIFENEAGEDMGGEMIIENRKIHIAIPGALEEFRRYRLRLISDVQGSDGERYHDEVIHDFVIPDKTPPVFTTSESMRISENSTFSLDVQVYDISKTIKYSLIGGDDRANFTLTQEGRLSVNSQFDFDKPVDADKNNVYELTIQAEDKSGNKTSQKLSITVTNVVEYPAIEAASVHIDENNEPGILVTTVNILNGGDAGIERFSLSSRDFSIDSAGNIFALHKFDYEKRKVYYLSVTALSPNGEQATETVRIFVNDIVEPLPEVSAFSGNIFETGQPGDVVGQMYVYPGAGADEKAVITLSGEGASDFTVSETGVITVSEGTELSHERRAKYQLQAYATNSRGKSQVVEVTLWINIWAKLFGASGDDFAKSIAIDNKNNIYIASLIYNPDNASGEEEMPLSYIHLSSIDIDGNVRWQKDFLDDFGEKIILDCDHDGYIYMSGSIDNDANGLSQSDLIMMKLDSSGETIWTNQYGSSENETLGAMQVHGETIYVAGSTYGGLGSYHNEGESDIFMMQFDLEGIKHSTIQYGSQKHDRAASLCIDDEGNAYIAGSSYGAIDGQINHGGNDMLLTKVAADGTRVWTKELGSDKDDYATAISLDSIGDIYVSGTTYGQFEGSEIFHSPDIFLTKFTPDGINQWSRMYGASSAERADAMMIDSLDNIFLAGMNHGGMAGDQSIKIDSDVLVSQIDAEGVMQWSQEIGTGQYDLAAGMAADNFGDFYILGSSEGDWNGVPGDGDYDAVLIKMPN